MTSTARVSTCILLFLLSLISSMAHAEKCPDKTPNVGYDCKLQEHDVIECKKHDLLCKYDSSENRKFFEVPLVNNKKHGEAILYYQRGGILKELYENDVKNGLSIEYDDLGNIRRTQEYKDGKIIGVSKCYYLHSDKLLRQTNYINGVPEGDEIEYYETGEIQTTAKYVAGKLDGEKIFYSKNGSISQTNPYHHGELNGVLVSYYMNGTVRWKTTFKDGKRNGPHIFYHENGVVREISNYKDDRQVGLKQVFNSKGNLEYDMFFEDGKINGNWRWYKDGVVVGLSAYEKGIREGIDKSFYKSGALRNTIPMHGHQKNGMARFYEENGREYAQIYYFNDFPLFGICKPVDAFLSLKLPFLDHSFMRNPENSCK